MRLVSVAALFALPAGLAAQSGINPPVPDPRAPMPERPTVATHAFTVARGFFELETGVERDENPDKTHSWLAPVYLKFGLAARAQLGVSVSVVRPPNEPLAAPTTAVGDLTLALKYRLADHVPFVGAFAVLPAVKFPTGDDAHGTTTTDASLLLISSHKFGDVALDVNLGYTHRSGDGSRAPQDATLWTVSGGVPITERFGMAIEVFGYPGTSGAGGSPPTTALLAGPTVALGTRAILDIGGIVHVHGPQPDALYAGITVNLGRF